VTTTTTLEGTAFAQKGKRADQNKGPYDKEYWKDKECYHCHQKGHPATHCCNKKPTDGGGSQKSNDDKSCSSKSSKASSISKLQKTMKKSFATLESKIEELEK
jgi:hypothetical protein